MDDISIASVGWGEGRVREAIFLTIFRISYPPFPLIVTQSFTLDAQLETVVLVFQSQLAWFDWLSFNRKVISVWILFQILR